MKDTDEINVREHEDDRDVQLYDPFARHFVSQNRQNDFLKSLEEGQAEVVYNTSH